LYLELRRRAAGAEPQGSGRALLSRGRSGCGRAGPRPAARRRGGRRAPLLRAVRPGSVLRRLREGRAQSRVSAATLRRSRELRAPRTRASGAFAARGDGLLNNRGRRRLGEEEGDEEEEGQVDPTAAARTSRRKEVR